jgi:uncharacterized protein (TIGR00162 family)
MKETVIIEKEHVELKDPILIEGLPGSGMIGKISVELLLKQLKAKKLADLYSPHFAYYVLMADDGSVRLLRSEFYYWKNEDGLNDLIFLTGDGQPQTIEGQYEVANSIIEFANKKKVKLIITLGGYRINVKENPKVFAFATNSDLLREPIKSGAKNGPPGNPIVGIAGLLLGLAKLKKINAVCLLTETMGFLPDPKAAQSVLTVLMKMLNLKVDLKSLIEEIFKSERIREKIEAIEVQRRVSEKIRLKVKAEKTSYIS